MGKNKRVESEIKLGQSFPLIEIFFIIIIVISTFIYGIYKLYWKGKNV